MNNNYNQIKKFENLVELRNEYQTKLDIINNNIEIAENNLNYDNTVRETIYNLNKKHKRRHCLMEHLCGKFEVCNKYWNKFKWC